MTPPREGGGHEVLVWGPAAEGERLADGRLILVPGWVWTCTCGASVIGHLTEDGAEMSADRHLAEMTP